jgi:crotonobetainyl-CoA:carnitine CoA-transferase CaiB-like acyl-CoA transferase
VPAIIYCSISGFGQSGPRKDEAGYDAVVQAEGGLMSITGAAAGTPYRLGVAISDIVTGMFATQGILLALLARTRTKVGQQVDIGLLDATVALLTYQASYSLTPQRSTKGMISSTTNARTSSLVRSAIAAFSLIGRSEVTWRRPRPRLVRPSTRGGSTEGSSINSM